MLTVLFLDFDSYLKCGNFTQDDICLHESWSQGSSSHAVPSENRKYLLFFFSCWCLHRMVLWTEKVIVAGRIQIYMFTCTYIERKGLFWQAEALREDTSRHNERTSQQSVTFEQCSRFYTADDSKSNPMFSFLPFIQIVPLLFVLCLSHLCPAWCWDKLSKRSAPTTESRRT